MVRNRYQPCFPWWPLWAGSSWRTFIRLGLSPPIKNVPVECVFCFQGSRGNLFCPSIGSQREGSFIDPLNEKISKKFLGTKKAADFVVKPAAWFAVCSAENGQKITVTQSWRTVWPYLYQLFCLRNLRQLFIGAVPWWQPVLPSAHSANHFISTRSHSSRSGGQCQNAEHSYFNNILYHN